MACSVYTHMSDVGLYAYYWVSVVHVLVKSALNSLANTLAHKQTQPNNSLYSILSS